MKKFLAAGAVAAAVFGAVGTADAGVEAIDANGNYLNLDADFNPSATSTKRTVGAAALGIHIAFGNKRNGQPFPTTQALALQLPKGSVYNGKLFPKCPLPTKSEEVGSDRCGKNTQIGVGGAVIDARRLGASDPIPATITAYNGGLRDGNPTLVLIAKATVGGNPISAEIDLVWTRGRLELFDPTNAGRIQYSFSEFDLETGALLKTKVRGRKAVFSLWETPKKCPARGWTFAFNHIAQDGGIIAAGDKQPCVQLKD